MCPFYVSSERFLGGKEIQLKGENEREKTFQTFLNLILTFPSTSQQTFKKGI